MSQVEKFQFLILQHIIGSDRIILSFSSTEQEAGVFFSKTSEVEKVVIAHPKSISS